MLWFDIAWYGYDATHDIRLRHFDREIAAEVSLISSKYSSDYQMRQIDFDRRERDKSVVVVQESQSGLMEGHPGLGSGSQATRQALQGAK